MAGGSHHHNHHQRPKSSASSSSHSKSSHNPVPQQPSQHRLPSDLRRNSDSKPSPAAHLAAKPSPRPGPSPRPPFAGQSSPLPPHFPDPMAALGPPPPPSYGFHMLERRTIVLADGSVRSYFALPPDYQDLPSRFFPPRPEAAMPQDYWSSLGLDTSRPGPSEGPGKRKLGDDRAVETPNRKRLQLGGTSRDRGELVPFSRDGKYGNGNVRLRHLDVDQVALKKAFLNFAKVLNENPHQKKNYLENGRSGVLKCLVCSRSSQDFPDMHSLVLHTYNSDNTDSLVDHLGLHKALCTLMGWNYSKPPDNSRVYQSLSPSDAAANHEDLIMWPPTVIVHNTITGKGKEGRMEGLGIKAMDNIVRELGISGGKSKSLYGREGHLGITLVKFAANVSGLREAMKLAEHFEKENRGRKAWAHLQPVTLGKDDENNPNLVRLDGRTGEKRRVLYAFLGLAADLDKLDFETRKKVTIESREDHLSL